MTSLNSMETDLANYLIEVMGEQAGMRTYKRWSKFLVSQFDYDKKKVDRYFRATEPTCDKNLISILDMKVACLCPHHLLPVEMIVNVGYVPFNKILGLSKFARIAKEYCKPPKTQEEYTAGLVKLISEKLITSWCMVMVKGVHSCMRHRGVESTDSVTWTNAIAGNKELSLKDEFQRLVLGNRE